MSEENKPIEIEPDINTDAEQRVCGIHRRMAHHRPHARVVFPNPGGVRAVYPVRRAYGNDRW